MILARAPLRVPLGGGGTDLPSYYSQFGGFVFSAAINKYVYIYVNRPAADDLIRVKYSRYEQVARVEQIQHDLVRPTLKLLEIDGGVEIVSMADVPDGTGLGSSGSYLVALLMALHEVKREKVETQKLAEQAYYIEMNLAGHPVGKHDHYLAAFGGITCLEVARDGKVNVTPLKLSLAVTEELRDSLLLFFTGISRSSRTILQEQKELTKEGNGQVVDSLHRTKELGYRIKEALEQGELERFGRLLDEHWQNKKRRSCHISNPQIDRWYEVAKQNGAWGGKIIGAGGGGFLLVSCPRQAKTAIRTAMAAEGLREMNFNFDIDFEGAKVLVNF